MSIIDQIRNIAASKGSSIALSYEGSYMTYGTLIKRMDGLAAALAERHIGPGHRVAIALPRSFDMIIAILGALTAGATYVPLDPSNPRTRLTTILENAQPTLLLSDDENAHLSRSSGIELLTPKRWPMEASIAKPVTPAGPAYIIYTSGSTGQPKGVVISHAALENYIQWAITTLPFTGGGVPLITSISFDHAVTSIFPPLVKGEKIVLLPPILGGRALASALLPAGQDRREPYSYVKLTPSLFSFLDKDQRAQLGSHTRLLMFGGEMLSPALVCDARRDTPHLMVMNHYGPTEATVGCCVYTLPEYFSDAIVPVGRPIPGMEASIRHTDLSPAGPMEEGELLISGIGLADGYWQLPTLTALSFPDLPDQGTGAGKRRWYRTGDRARMTRDGDIEYLGRIDAQIKLLGHRIEPAEITACLDSLPYVSRSAVVAHEHTTPIELVAVIVLNGSQKPSMEDIREHLLNILPSVMVPAHILILDEIPVAASGKTDIKKLREILADTPALPMDDTIEAAVTNKFREVLCMQNIDPDDDFFFLGGDSLGTVEIATWAGERYHIPLEISCIFDFATVNSLSGHIRTLIKAGTASS